MKYFAWAAAALALIGLIWWMQTTATADPKASRASDAGLARVAIPTPLPAFDAGPPSLPVDARPADAAIDEEFVRVRGTIGMPVALVERAINKTVLGDSWLRDKAGRLEWKNGRDVLVSLAIEGDRVVGGRVSFGKASMTADLQGASMFLTGQTCALVPHGYEQADESLGRKRSGQFECHGRVIYYKGEVDFGGPARPLWFEYRETPIP